MNKLISIETVITMTIKNGSKQREIKFTSILPPKRLLIALCQWFNKELGSHLTVATDREKIIREITS